MNDDYQKSNVLTALVKKSFMTRRSLSEHQNRSNHPSDILTLLTVPIASVVASCFCTIFLITPKNMLSSKSFSTTLAKVILTGGVVTSSSVSSAVRKSVTPRLFSYAVNHQNLSCSRFDYTFGSSKRGQSFVRGFSTSGMLYKSDSSESDPKWVENPKLIPNEEWAKRLNPEQYFCTREGGTEPPFSGQYLNHKAEGLYTCVCCGSELFSSKTKYDSKSGWPSFYAALEPHGSDAAGSSVIRRKDISHGMVRNEIICKNCNAHLGHVFEDGPEPTKERFCVNSAALKFVPKKL